MLPTGWETPTKESITLVTYCIFSKLKMFTEGKWGKYKCTYKTSKLNI